PTIMVGFAVALILGGTLRAIAKAESRLRAAAISAAAIALVGPTGWPLYTFRPTGGGGEAGDEHALSRSAASPEHLVGDDLQALRAALRDTHEQVRVDAVGRLAASGDPRIFPDLLEALHDQSAAVGGPGRGALLRVGTRAPLPALQQGLKNADEDPWVRLRMAQAAAGMGDDT